MKTPSSLPPELRQTPVERTPLAPERRATFDPVLWLVELKRAPRFWFVLFVLAVACLLLERVLLPADHGGNVVVLDASGGSHAGQLLPFREARALHLQQCAQATQAFLNRTPNDFDNPELLELFFSAAALAKARAQFAQEAPERAAKQLHQKVEIANIDLLQTRDDQLLADVTGQLLRTGLFQEQPFTEGVPFRLRLKLTRNPNPALSGRVPTVVTDFKYETNN